MPIDNRPFPPPAGTTHPLRGAAIVIYGTFALLVVTIPQSLVNRLNDLEENPAQQVLLRGAEAVQAASHAVFLDRLYIQARFAFLALTGKEDD
jgi:hypothetical protein